MLDPQRRLAVLLLCAAGLDCRAPAPSPSIPPRSSAFEHAAARPTGAPSGALLDELAGWQTCDLLTFEDEVERLKASTAVRWSAAARDAYAQALPEASLTSVRAAVLLGIDRSPESTALLCTRLEARAPAPARERNAVDIVAAAALEGRLDAVLQARLLRLVEGAGAHPDLEVRVECARVLARAGSTKVYPFLLRVLRVETPDQELDPPDWIPTTTLFWAKFRAAEVLAEHAKLPMTFRPDASFADQAREASRLAHALGYTRPARR